MAGTTSFPGTLDDFSTSSPPQLADNDSTGRTHSERHDDMEAAMEAVQNWALADNEFRPEDQGFITWSQDIRSTSNTSGTPTAGTIYLVKVLLRRAATLSRVHYVQATSPTLTGGFVGVYSPDGTRQAVSADIGTGLNSAGHKAVNLLAPYAAPAGWVWLAILHLGTTAGIIRGAGSSQYSVNANMTAANYNYAINGTGASALPASITPSANANPANSEVWWLAAS